MTIERSISRALVLNGLVVLAASNPVVFESSAPHFHSPLRDQSSERSRPTRVTPLGSGLASHPWAPMQQTIEERLEVGLTAKFSDAGDEVVRIIDLEYGSINYAAFDIANH